MNASERRAGSPSAIGTAVQRCIGYQDEIRVFGATLQHMASALGYKLADFEIRVENTSEATVVRALMDGDCHAESILPLEELSPLRRELLRRTFLGAAINAGRTIR